MSESSTHEEIIFRDDVSVELTKASASDADVIWAARVSTAGEQSIDEIGEDPARSAGLINYLARERHGSPFEHTSMTFFISAPIFVFREFMRHRIASYNEESGRYRELKPVFYIPNADRNLIQIGKTGAYEFVPGTTEQFQTTVEAMKKAYGTGGCMYGLFLNQFENYYRLAFMDYLKNVEFKKGKNDLWTIESSEEIEPYNPSKLQITIFKFDKKKYQYIIDSTYIQSY